MRRPDNTRTAEIVLVAGSSGCGKTTWLKRRIRKEPAVLVWDVKDEYGHGRDFHRITSRRALVETLKATPTGRYAFAGPPTGECFEFWCRAAWAWGDAVLIAEELPAVTHAGKASGTWGRILNQGRGYGLRVYVTAQRPAEIDKTTIGNCTLIHTGRLQRHQDRQYLAREMDVDPATISGLKPLEWVEKEVTTGAVHRGKVRF